MPRLRLPLSAPAPRRSRAIERLRHRRAGFGQEAHSSSSFSPHEGNRARSFLRTPPSTSPRAYRIDAMLRRWIDGLASALGAGESTSPRCRPRDRRNGLRFAASADSVAAGRRRPGRRTRPVQKGERSGRSRPGCLGCGRPTHSLSQHPIPSSTSRALSRASRRGSVSLPSLDATEAHGIIEAICNRCTTSSSHSDRCAAREEAGAGLPAFGDRSSGLVLAIELDLLDDDDFASMQHDMPRSSGKPTGN